MIITLKSLANQAAAVDAESATIGPLGKKAGGVTPLDYSQVGMWGVLLCSGALAIAGLIICMVSALHDRLGLVYAGLVILLIGTYLMIVAVKEKANLDLIAGQFKNLSAQTKDELLRALVKGNIGAASGVLGLIEKLINVVSGQEKTPSKKTTSTPKKGNP